MLREEHGGLRLLHAHYLFDIGCCHAYLGQLAEAQQELTRAIAIYREWYHEMPERTWCLEGIARSERLLAAMRDSRQEELLVAWRTDSIRNLKLEKIV